MVPKFAANLTMLFGELPFLDRFAAAKAAGFSGVEYLFPMISRKRFCANACSSMDLRKDCTISLREIGRPASGESPFFRTGSMSSGMASIVPSITRRLSIVIR